MRRPWLIGIAVCVLLVGGTLWLVRGSAPQPYTDGTVVSGTFGGALMRIEFALSEAAKEKGLGGRSALPRNFGMLFVFAKDGRYGFWMKDTLVPLDMFWLNDRGRVVSMVEDVATSTYPNAFYPSLPARYVLETAAGFGSAHNIATGTALVLKKFPVVSK